MASQDHYLIKMRIIDLKTEDEIKCHTVDISTQKGRDFFQRTNHWAWLNGKGVATELDRIEVRG